MDAACLYFDLFKPAPRGFAYVGASRVRAHHGLYYFGRVRRSDWLPVGGTAEDEQPDRGHLSESEVSGQEGAPSDGSSDCSDGSLFDGLRGHDSDDDAMDLCEYWVNDEDEAARDIEDWIQSNVEAGDDAMDLDEAFYELGATDPDFLQLVESMQALYSA